ncbi:MAG: hypothetical protein IJ940_10005, partial [Bacteroidales bacterium]|nr:hypothetical protein [Bacteroidales bacterium]
MTEDRRSERLKMKVENNIMRRKSRMAESWQELLQVLKYLRIFARFSSGRKTQVIIYLTFKTDSQWLLKFVFSATERRISHSSTLLWLIH